MKNTDVCKIWKDQEDFNKNFFPEPITYEEQSRQTKEMVLCAISELNELLNAIKWKQHRKEDKLCNRDLVKEELTDILKYWISLCVIWKVSPEEAMNEYWRKSMVVRQRYSEEYVQSLEGEIVIVDIDGVLADYYLGLLHWVSACYPDLSEKCKLLSLTKEWLNAETLGIDSQAWQEIKHEFRTKRGKLTLPPYLGANELLKFFKGEGYKIVLLTSRPIDKYPNIYTDTLEWLKANNMPFDFIWWATDKSETILSKGIKPNIKYAIDDDFKYIESYQRLGINTFWIDHLDRDMNYDFKKVTKVINTLQIVKILEKLKEVEV